MVFFLKMCQCNNKYNHVLINSIYIVLLLQYKNQWCGSNVLYKSFIGEIYSFTLKSRFIVSLNIHFLWNYGNQIFTHWVPIR